MVFAGSEPGNCVSHWFEVAMAMSNGTGGVSGPRSPTRRSANHAAAVLDSPHRT